MRASSLCTDITLSAPVLYITSTLDPIESLSDTAQGLGYPQVPRGREVVQLLKYFGSMCFREYELFLGGISSWGLPQSVQDTIDD